MTEKKQYDLIVIGGGPGGYVAAIRAAQLSLNVLCIEKTKSLGGTCLNVGCIPSKTLLHSSYLYSLSKKHFIDIGIDIEGEVKVDLGKMMSNKSATVKKLTDGVGFLLKKNKVSFLEGNAKIIKQNLVSVNGEEFRAKNILIATGSVPSVINNVDIDEKDIVSSTGALEFSSIPKNLAVIGGGYIGLELGSVWKRLGSNVTVIEFSENIVPTMDEDTASIFFKTLKGQGLNFLLNTGVEKARKEGKKVLLSCSNNISNTKEDLAFDKVLVSVGRKPYHEGLGLEELGVKINKNNTIEVDNNFQTSIPNIFAIGDVIEGPMLAHKASAEGHVFAERLAGNSPVLNYGCIPAVIYTEPEVAWVGPTEKELQQKGITYKKGVFPFTANARAKTTGDTEGNIKVLSHPKNDKIIAVHIIGAHAGELIGEAATALEAGLSAEDIALICHAHPTLSESMKEAASLASIGKTLHF
jgi:dihydrolipoamide dehydrogenase